MYIRQTEACLRSRSLYSHLSRALFFFPRSFSTSGYPSGALSRKKQRKSLLVVTPHCYPGSRSCCNAGICIGICILHSLLGLTRCYSVHISKHNKVHSRPARQLIRHPVQLQASRSAATALQIPCPRAPCFCSNKPCPASRYTSVIEVHTGRESVSSRRRANGQTRTSRQKWRYQPHVSQISHSRFPHEELRFSHPSSLTLTNPSVPPSTVPNPSITRPSTAFWSPTSVACVLLAFCSSALSSSGSTTNVRHETPQRNRTTHR